MGFNARHDRITVVSGLPRSGTSMMMQMIEAGGMAVLTDTTRVADEDNPRGYYEYGPVQRLGEDASWLAEAGGKVVKIVSELLRHLPKAYEYRLVLMERSMEEVLASQRAMLVRRGMQLEADVDDEQMAGIYRKHLSRVGAWAAVQPNVDVLRADYGRVVARPCVWARKIERFLDAGLDADAMAAAVDAVLHRQTSRSG